jgi:peptidoglycan/xylan/chitin deacetylase (PgdA/CDA1 family)
MKNKSTIRIILSISHTVLFCFNIYTQENGDTRIAYWKDDKAAAFSLNFDDSMPSHVDNAIPLLKERGLTGTFFVNPGKSRHQDNEEFWQNLLNEGQEMAPHTMNHDGASSYDEAVYEIGESAKYVWDVYGVPHYSELHAYASGGGVTWSALSREERLEIDDSFLMINRYHFDISTPHWHSDRLPRSLGGNTSASSLISFFDSEVAQGKWEAILFHGVGGGWISIDLDEFISFVDYLETKKNSVWIGPWINVYKYDMERFSAQVEVLKSTSNIIKLRLSSDVVASGCVTNDVNLYNEPLTLITQVPWTNVIVTQGSSSKSYTAINGVVMYDAFPNVGTTDRGNIILQESEVLNVDSTSGGIIPDGFNLEQNYPNPFNPTTTIKFSIPIPLSPPFNKRRKTGGFVSLKVFDVLGKEIATLVNEEKAAGNYEVKFSRGLIHQSVGGGLTSGIYFYRLKVRDPSTSSTKRQAGQSFVETRKMLLMK